MIYLTLKKKFQVELSCDILIYALCTCGTIGCLQVKASLETHSWSRFSYSKRSETNHGFPTMKLKVISNMVDFILEWFIFDNVRKFFPEVKWYRFSMLMYLG